MYAKKGGLQFIIITGFNNQKQTAMIIPYDSSNADEKEFAKLRKLQVEAEK